MNETWVVYVDLRLKNGATDNAGEGVEALRDAFGSMADDGWQLATSISDLDQGTTVGAWLLFQRMGDVTKQADRIVAEMSKPAAMDLSRTTEGPV